MLPELSFEIKELARLILGEECSRKKEHLMGDSGTQAKRAYTGDD